ncbi:hypothetical protein [Candidatus Finniella inopinata]|uniref:Uncharacterized protein n=1 Tax=Candidatus Finniella inopinata TaxID=1696036 RepID=A0A4Q7DHU7_9PROT|nr:hypothetical protein [Candidatus Finniella inopinata]RZI46282.1 hypothetical protein EQU50_04930 [Candidatus Finniella inopinata]
MNSIYRIMGIMIFCATAGAHASTVSIEGVDYDVLDVSGGFPTGKNGGVIITLARPARNGDSQEGI